MHGSDQKHESIHVWPPGSYGIGGECCSDTEQSVEKKKDIGSLFNKFQYLPYFSETQHTSPTAFRLFRSVFFNINSLIILQCTTSNTMEHLSFILFSQLRYHREYI